MIAVGLPISKTIIHALVQAKANREMLERATKTAISIQADPNFLSVQNNFKVVQRIAQEVKASAGAAFSTAQHSMKLVNPLSSIYASAASVAEHAAKSFQTLDKLDLPTRDALFRASRSFDTFNRIAAERSQFIETVKSISAEVQATTAQGAGPARTLSALSNLG